MKCVIRPAARDDIIRQYRYYLVSEAAPLAAERFLEAVRVAVLHLRRLPVSGRPLVTENPLLIAWRSWPVKGFEAIRLYYIVRQTEVCIIRVLHSRRDIESILEKIHEEEP